MWHSFEPNKNFGKEKEEKPPRQDERRPQQHEMEATRDGTEFSFQDEY